MGSAPSSTAEAAVGARAGSGSPGGGGGPLTRAGSRTDGAPPGASQPAPRSTRRRGGIPWRKWVRVLHRDVGYLAAGLTLIYAASGVAVNHRSDWNPNYEIRRETVGFPGVSGSEAEAPGTDAWARRALAVLGVTAGYRGTFMPDAATVDVFVDGGTVTVELEAGRATVEVVRPRPLLRPANFLHLNEPGGLWTWMADLYAGALALLALTGLFVVRGRKGITGRGAWLTTLGVAIPVAFLLFLYF